MWHQKRGGVGQHEDETKFGLILKELKRNSRAKKIWKTRFCLIDGGGQRKGGWEGGDDGGGQIQGIEREGNGGGVHDCNGGIGLRELLGEVWLRG